MEVKINREIRNYTESMFFGLSLRQLIFSALAMAVAVGLYFLLKPYVGTETVSWVCVLGAAPFAALGFFTYHGMTAEQFIWAWLRSEVLEPRELRFESSTLYYDLLKPSIDKWEKEEYKRNHGIIWQPLPYGSYPKEYPPLFFSAASRWPNYFSSLTQFPARPVR